MTENDRYHIYLEIVEFLHSCGGPYQAIEPKECLNLIECLYAGRYVLRRDDAGAIRFFADYWMVDPQELPAIRTGKEPEDKDGGATVYIVDFATRGPFLAELRRELDERHPGWQGAAWFHKRATPENFKHYPSQRGEKRHG